MIFFSKTVLIGALFVFGCGENHDTALGGVGTDAGESTAKVRVTGQVVNSSGVAVAGAKVYLRPEADFATSEEPVALGKILTQLPDSALTDSTGSFVVGGDHYGYYLLQTISNYQSATARILLNAEHPNLYRTQTIHTMTSVQGTVVYSLTPSAGAKVQIPGLNRETICDANGKFVFDSLPDEGLLFSVTPASSNESKWFAWHSGGSLPKFDLNERGMILDDFEEPSRFSLPGFLLGDIGGKWWFSKDPADVHIVPGSGEDFVLGIEDSSAHNGTSLRVQMQVPSSINTFNYGMVGLDLGRNYEDGSKDYFDLSTMTSFTFWAKGSGTIRLQFDSYLVTEVLNDYHQFTVEFHLTPDWKQFRITPNQILAIQESVALAQGKTWADASDKISAIAFLSSGDADLWLDDLQLEGVDLLNYLHQGLDKSE